MFTAGVIVGRTVMGILFELALAETRQAASLIIPQVMTSPSAIDGWIFVVTGFGAMLITLATVSYQSIRAGLSNPVKSIRTE